MKKEVTMHTVICDNCGDNLFDDADYSCGDLAFVGDELDEQDWKEVEGKDYCGDCWSYDDNDNLVIKSKKI